MPKSSNNTTVEGTPKPSLNEGCVFAHEKRAYTTEECL
ncbi:hypothetical protein A2U01_0065310, partial [Trifolium medium]|nr:hypothetical protein [Trifolium medium]